MQKLPENQAVARGKYLPISTKKSVDICLALKGKTPSRAKQYLLNVLAHKEAIPVRRHKKDIPHKVGMAGGIYPRNATLHILKIIDLAEKNAHFKGLDTTHLIIKNIRADKAGRPFHTGRQGRRAMKRSHIEVIVEEYKTGNVQKKEKKTEKPKAEKKQ